MNRSPLLVIGQDIPALLAEGKYFHLYDIFEKGGNKRGRNQSQKGKDHTII